MQKLSSQKGPWPAYKTGPYLGKFDWGGGCIPCGCRPQRGEVCGRGMCPLLHKDKARKLKLYFNSGGGGAVAPPAPPKYGPAKAFVPIWPANCLIKSALALNLTTIISAPLHNGCNSSNHFCNLVLHLTTDPLHCTSPKTTLQPQTLNLAFSNSKLIIWVRGGGGGHWFITSSQHTHSRYLKIAVK